MYCNSSTEVRCQSGTSEKFEEKVEVHQEEVRRQSSWDMMYADDVICTNERETSEKLGQWTRALERHGMRVELRQYLNAVQEDGGSDAEVAKSIQAGWNSWRKVTGVLCDRRVNAKVKGGIHKTIVRPAILYGLEGTALTKTQERTLEIAEMRRLRWSLGLTRRERVRNEYIRGTLRVPRV
ncbi:uncharacterized protein LOC122250179 [Penaeus japonicus]|uniref:uncharacterized protein LOC122250179 n=1 Tax=Penaeus japonicus TaxID=27405 RepID=UPI001C70F7BA|nr:uncharacterized protein LOC122250179 [Penaeus japonicus]